MANVINDNQREMEVQELCRQIINMSPKWDYTDNETQCPLCYKVVKHNDNASMSEIKHDTNCAYLIAKDLTTNLL